MAVPYIACMAVVAAFYQLPPRVLPSIQLVGGGEIGVASRNTDGTEDLGVMQVNTIWIEPIARHTGYAPAVVRARLINDACFNIAASGAILKTYLNEAGGDLLRAIGYYHSHTPWRGERYQARVLDAATRLFFQPQPPPQIARQPAPPPVAQPRRDLPRQPAAAKTGRMPSTSR